jgi:hypothetical protein
MGPNLHEVRLAKKPVRGGRARQIGTRVAPIVAVQTFAGAAARPIPELPRRRTPGYNAGTRSALRHGLCSVLVHPHPGQGISMKPTVSATARALAVLGAVTAIATTAACGGRSGNIPGTQVSDSKFNRDIIATIEDYRLAVERRDAASLMLMASPQYWEDSGTPSGGDDYGFDGLGDVLAGRFQQADDVRFSIRYVSIRRRCPSADAEVYEGCRAYVQVLIDASFSISDARDQQKRPDMRDRNELVLEWADGDRKWKFLSGM